MHNPPDLIAAVQAEAHRRHGLVLTDDEAALALRSAQYPAPLGQRWARRPEHEAAVEALRWWRVEHELDRPGPRVAAGG